ncbi:ABC transporter substrate-binding protein [Actinotalea sp. M2MS4P-6]|uniref:ABC transporter substrate-binding protein n=1 Tax=Actinotalea sp. M2MS4P-6 TaxID=2983762 RepID=UPI0021E3EDFB|nr:ABC transporter substrate-binding protein [Actinotalea sp. M2MS4P-6]MCV2394254.1 ABC transporter substrate-binding protein [Actinotalea sp. M2MS4P-6]
MRTTKFAGVAVMAAAALVLAACSSGGTTDDASSGGDSSSSSSDAGSGDELYVALISKGFQHQFWQAVKLGAEQAADELGVRMTFDGPDSEAEVEQQLQQLQTALNANPDAIGFAALDSEASIPILEQAQSAGIPIVAFDSGVDSDIPVTTASTDNKAAAAEAATHMAELADHTGDVAIVCHDQTSITGIERRDGFVEYMESNEPDMNVVDIQYGGGDQLKSTDITKAILQANPDLVGIYGCNEGSAIGIVNGVNELNMSGKVIVIGFDSGQAQIDAIKSGLMAGAITQNPVGIGYETVKAAVAAINGEDLPTTIDTGYYWYDSTNIDDPEIQAVLYE